MEVKTTVLTTELYPLISALKNEMQKKGYSPSSMREGWKMFGMRCLDTHPRLQPHHLMKNSGKDSYRKNTAFVWIWSTPCTEPAVRLSY